MYTATMRYHFKEGSFTEGCNAWKETVLAEAKGRTGLIRMQWLEAKPRALAIGTWNDQSQAQAFMQTGVFKRLTAKLENLVTEKPEPELWSLEAFYQA